MTDETRTRRRRSGGSGIVFPLILIAAGILFLLDNLDVLNVDWWELWRLWPLLLVLLGLDLLLGGRSTIGNLVVAVAGLVLLAAALYFVAVGDTGQIDLGGTRHTLTVEEPLDGAELAELDLHMAAGDLSIAALVDSDLLIEGVLEVDSREPTWQAARDGSTVRLTLDQTGGVTGPFSLDAGDDWRVLLSPRVGYDLDVELNAGSAGLDLAGLDLRALVVDAGAARTDLTFPASGDYTARVTGGVGGIELTIPRDVAVRLHVERGLTTLDLPSRYHRQGDLYVAGDWDRAEDRLDLFVDMGVGLLTIRDN